MDSLPNYSPSSEPNSHFQPYQIVCLEHEDARLYAEVVQLVEVKRSCWVHPLVLIWRSPSSSTPFEEFGQGSDPTAFTLHDLRQGADLVWPTILFRAALDVEVIPLFTCLYQAELTSAEKDQNIVVAHQSLTQFIRQLWQAHTDVFNH
jgi:hypothetical protein